MTLLILDEYMRFISSKYVFRERIFQRNFLLELPKFNFKSWNVVFFGTDEFSLGSLKVLHQQVKEKLIGNLEVVTKNENCPVFQYAKSNNIKTQFWPPTLICSYDFGVLVSFGKIIPKKIIDLFPYGIINVHPSLLPRWRGGMPIVHTIKNGDTITGITVIRINSIVDAGDIILQKPVPVGEHEMMPSLFNKLNKIGGECLLQVIQNMPECLDSMKPQSDEAVTKAPVLDKSAAVVQWDSMTAMEIYNLYRSFSDKFPVWSTWKGEKITFLCLSPTNTVVFNSEEKMLPGMFVYSKKSNRIVVQTIDNAIEVCTMRYKGKIKTAHNFYIGYLTILPKADWRFGS